MYGEKLEFLLLCMYKTNASANLRLNIAVPEQV